MEKTSVKLPFICFCQIEMNTFNCQKVSNLELYYTSK